jgi:Protein of unknown function (DUF1360)
MATAATPPLEQLETDDRPVEAADYAVINAAYGSLLITLALAAHQRRRPQLDPIAGRELASLGLATFALSKLVVHERVVAWVRQPFVARAPGGERRPRGTRLRYAMGELLTCTRCVGGWSALALVGLRVSSPSAARVVTSVLCASAINDFLQAGFRALCDRA